MTLRFFRRGVSRVYWLPAVVDAAAPTGPEIVAGTELTPHIAEMSGWERVRTSIAVPDLGSDFTRQIAGEATVQNPTITFYDERDMPALRTMIAEGTAAWIMLAPHGLVSGERADLWLAEVLHVNDAYTVASEAAKFQAAFAVLEAPKQGVTLP